MPRRTRSAPDGLVYHVLNRANGRAAIFRKPQAEATCWRKDRMKAAVPFIRGDIEIEAQPELFVGAFRHFMRRDKKLPPVLRGLSATDLNTLRTAFAESALSLLIV